MTYKIPVELIKNNNAPKTKKPKKPVTLAEKEKIAEAYAKSHAKRRADMYAKFVPEFITGYYERPLNRKDFNDKDKWLDGINELRKPQKKRTGRPKKASVDVYGNPITGEVKKVEPKKATHHTLEDLKRIKGLKDEIEALKTRMVRKDATIKNLKRKIEKLKETIERPEKEKQQEKQFYLDNPDFLEIN